MPPTALDPQAVSLAKAIRQTESGGNFQARGGSGEYGAYQFMPATWDATAKKFGVNVPLEQATPEQQNQVAYSQIKAWKDEGLNVGQIASAWNAGYGRKNAYVQGWSGENDKGVSYDTPAYAKKVAEAYQSFKVQAPQTGTAPSVLADSSTVASVAPEERTLGGFGQNVIKSGAGLLAGVGNAILHPIQTAQNIGGAAVGGLETLAGQETENTAKFDGLVNFFKDRYGGLDNLEKTLYEDPLGVVADISTVLGGAGLGLKAGGLAAKTGKAGEVAGALNRAGDVLNKASDFTNPLAPVGAGIAKVANAGLDVGAGAVGKLAGLEPATIAAIRNNPDAFTPQQIASVTREVVGDEVGGALNARIKSLNETSSAYKPYRESIEEIPVARNFLEDQFRKVAGVNVVDGQIVASGASAIRNATDLAKLQKTLDLWKPELQSGKLTPAKFLNLRKDLGDLAYNDLGKKSGDVARVTDEIRRNLNKEYRAKIKGLEELDTNYSTETENLRRLKKGLIDKDGKLTDTAYSLIANAGNKGNAQRLARLEEIVPGIGKKLEVLKAIEDVQKSMGNKVGTYGKSILESGGIIAGMVSGQWQVVATGFAAAFIAEPANAVKILRAAESIDPKLVPQILSRVARYATITSTVSEATQTGEREDSTGTESLLNDLSTPADVSSLTPGEIPSVPASPEETKKALDELVKAKNFDLEAALAEGYTEEDIRAYLQGV